MEVNPNKIQLSEKDIEDWLFENPKEITFCRDIYKLNKWIGRQVKVPSGIIDLLGVVKTRDRNYLTVVEIKNTQFTQASLLQVSRYAMDVSDIASSLNVSTDGEIEETVLKVVIGIGEPSNQILFEADSINVFLISFEVDFNISLTGSWKFSQDFRKINNQVLEKLRDSDLFKNILDCNVPKNIQDFIDTIPDEIENDDNG